MISYAERIKKLPPYLFIEIDKKKKILEEKGVDLINLGVGDPDQPTPPHIIRAMKKALDNPKYHQYSFGPGLLEFREAISNWVKKRFGFYLDPISQIHSLIGSKEGVGHIPLAFINQGDIVLVPEPGYPAYKGGAILAGGEPYYMPLLEKNNFLPDLSAIPKDVISRAKLMFVNYPNNPTGALATKVFFKSLIEWAKKNNIIVVHDAAYSEMFFDDEKPLSFLQIEGAFDVGIELHSFSKTYNMTGWRLGWACGNQDILKGLNTVKNNYDSGVFSAVQIAGIAALMGEDECVKRMRELYIERRNIFVEGLTKLGWQVSKCKATFYIWAKVPQGYTSMDTVSKILEDASVIATPGSGFGPSGEGYIRFALTVDSGRLIEASKRMEKIKW